MYGVLSGGYWNCTIFDATKENSSDLLSGSHRNIIQFFGSLVWPATLLLTPWPLLPCCVFGTIRNVHVCIPHHIHTFALMELLLEMGYEYLLSVFIKRQNFHRQSTDSGLLLRLPRLCSQSVERMDRYYHCYLAADILRDQTWHLGCVGFRTD